MRIRRSGTALLLLAGIATSSGAWSPPPSRDDGWSGIVEFGAQRFTGNTRSSSLSSSLSLGYGNGRFESLFGTEYLTSSTSLVKPRRDENGTVIVDDEGEEVLDVVTGRSHRRWSLQIQPRWFWTDRVYQFALFDWQRDPPAGTDRLERRVVGGGYKLWKSRTDYFATEVGVGTRRFESTSSSPERDTIGYLAFRFVRRLDGRVRLDAALDADVAGDRMFAELKMGIALPLNDRVSLKLRHVERWNRRDPNPRNPLDSRSDGITTLSLEVALFLASSEIEDDAISSSSRVR